MLHMNERTNEITLRRIEPGTLAKNREKRKKTSYPLCSQIFCFVIAYLYTVLRQKAKNQAVLFFQKCNWPFVPIAQL